jgi:hypothetical protein
MERKPSKKTQLARFISATLVCAEQAEYWAATCTWLPGTGRCQTQTTIECGLDCPFRPMREGEVNRIEAHRRRRRAVHRYSR